MTHTDTPIDTDWNCMALRYPNGWYEIREVNNAEGWLRTGQPVWAEP
jgi:hypothetical protein